MIRPDMMKMATYIKVLDVSEERLPTLKQTFLRDIGGIVIGGLALAYMIYRVTTDANFFGTGFDTMIGQTLGYAGFYWSLLEIVTMFTNDKRRALHDYIAGTVVARK